MSPRELEFLFAPTAAFISGVMLGALEVMLEVVEAVVAPIAILRSEALADPFEPPAFEVSANTTTAAATTTATASPPAQSHPLRAPPPREESPAGIGGVGGSPEKSGIGPSRSAESARTASTLAPSAAGRLAGAGPGSSAAIVASASCGGGDDAQICRDRGAPPTASRAAATNS